MEFFCGQTIEADSIQEAYKQFEGLTSIPFDGCPSDSSCTRSRRGASIWAARDRTARAANRETS